jgi:hypothetical protein
MTICVSSNSLINKNALLYNIMAKVEAEGEDPHFE